jgi:hypothetical protein
MSPFRKILVALVIAAGLLSEACYVKQDENGQWWACEDYQTPNGIVSGCTPLGSSF